MTKNRKIIVKYLWIISCIIGSYNGVAQEKLYLNTFPLTDVRLLDGPFKYAQDLRI